MIHVATTDADIMSCYAVMRELRPHIREEDFLAIIRAQEREGFRVASLSEDGRVVAVAGFRILHNLAWGRFLYVDDLVTSSQTRSRGHGAALLAWLHGRARDEGCAQLHLDSGTQRKDAHRFYAREGMDLSAYHYQTVLD